MEDSTRRRVNVGWAIGNGWTRRAGGLLLALLLNLSLPLLLQLLLALQVLLLLLQLELLLALLLLSLCRAAGRPLSWRHLLRALLLGCWLGRLWHPGG